MSAKIKRREFITLLGGGAAAWPLAARAQQPERMRRIGVLSSITSPDLSADRWRAFHRGLSETGYAESRNVTIEYRWAEGHYDRLPALARDLVRVQVSVIAAFGGVHTPLAAKAATATIPIVFELGADPVQLGLVPNFNRPGANVTGVTQLNTEVAPKRLELLHELIPTTSLMALLLDPTDPTNADTQSTSVLSAAQRLGLKVHVLNASSERDFDRVFASVMQLRAGGLVIGAHGFFTARSEQLGALAARHAVPAAYENREFVAAGGLVSYGGGISDAYRLAGVYAARILKGEKPAELPVQQSTKVEMFLNLKAANALGITVPLPLLGRADEVIE